MKKKNYQTVITEMTGFGCIYTRPATDAELNAVHLEMNNFETGAPVVIKHMRHPLSPYPGTLQALGCASIVAKE